MSDTREAAGAASARFESVSPILPVRDLPRAIAFYRQALGFELAWSWGTPPRIAAVCRDAVEITLARAEAGEPAGTAHVYLRVSSIDACHAAAVQAGATVLVPIGDRDYGLRDVRIADPDGNQISIGAPIDAAAP